MCKKAEIYKGGRDMNTLILILIIIALFFIMLYLRKKICIQKQIISDLEKWHRMALTDSLTQISNRTAYNNHIQRLKDNITEKDNVSIVLFDIDNFKKINDTYGHLVGDKVLKRCAYMLCEVFKEPDSIVYRIGGDEFAVISQNITEKHIIDNLLEIRKYENSGLGFTLSKGYSCSSGRKDFVKTFNRADEMLYADKFSKNKEDSKI